MGCAESVPINSLPPTVSQRKKAAESYLDYSAEDAKTDGEFWTCDKNTIVPVRFSNSGAASEKYCPAMTLPSIFKMAMERRGDKVALRVERGLPEYVKGQDVPPSEPLENWASWTWKE